MTVPNLGIRPFEPDDLPALHRVRQAAFEPVFSSFRDIVGEAIAAIAFAHADREQAELLDEVCRPDSGYHVLSVTVGDEIVGFVSFTTDAGKRVGEFALNAVHPAHAGRGIGTAMYEHVVTRMRALGMVIAEVSTGGDPAHAPARRAYEKFGFRAAIPAVSLYKVL